MSGYPLLDVFLSTLYFFCWILWILLLFWIVWDIFRSRDLSGWGKAGWLIFVVVLPFLGVLVYLIVRGGTMHERRVSEAQAVDSHFQSQVRQAEAADGHSQSDELTKLAGLHERGIINDEEFQRAKSRIL